MTLWGSWALLFWKKTFSLQNIVYLELLSSGLVSFVLLVIPRKAIHNDCLSYLTCLYIESVPILDLKQLTRYFCYCVLGEMELIILNDNVLSNFGNVNGMGKKAYILNHTLWIHPKVYYAWFAGVLLCAAEQQLTHNQPVEVKPWKHSAQNTDSCWF